MFIRVLTPALFALAFALPAAAAPSSSSSSNQSGTASGTSNDQASSRPTPQIAAKLRQSLTQAGFTDVRLMPESFLVHAKDKDGNPVMMVVNPDSVTSVTALGTSSNGNSSSKSATGGSGMSTSQNGSNSTTKE